MSQSRLIELTYFDPGKSVRLVAYADTIILDRNGTDSVISAIRFGGYPEMVKASQPDGNSRGPICSPGPAAGDKHVQG